MSVTGIDRIRKLLAKAERAATAEEAEAYTAKAVELMARRGVDAAVLAAGRPGSDEVGLLRVDVDGPYSAGRARLLGWTAGALGCRWVQHGLRGGRVAAVTVVGHRSDRERVQLLYPSLLLQATAQMARLRPPRAGESVAAFRRSWLHGFAAQVHHRLVEAERRAAVSADARGAGGGPSGDGSGAGGPAGGLAPVLAERRARVDRACAEAFPQLGRARGPALSGSGFAAGALAGQRADLGGGGLARGARRALGA